MILSGWFDQKIHACSWPLDSFTVANEIHWETAFRITDRANSGKMQRMELEITGNLFFVIQTCLEKSIETKIYFLLLASSGIVTRLASPYGLGSCPLWAVWEWRLSHQNQHRDVQTNHVMLKYVECNVRYWNSMTRGKQLSYKRQKVLIDSTLNRTISCYAASHSTREDQKPGCFGEHVWRSATHPLSDNLEMKTLKDIWRSSTHAWVELHFQANADAVLTATAAHTAKRFQKKNGPSLTSEVQHHSTMDNIR